MANMSLKKVAMPEQDPNVRNKNFEEVALGYTKEMAMEEATRCLNCKNKPCVGGCPVNVPIPAFIEKVAAGDFEEMCIRDSQQAFRCQEERLLELIITGLSLIHI